MFDAGVLDAARPDVFADRAIGIGAVDGAGEGRIEEDMGPFQPGNDAVEIDLVTAWSPGIDVRRTTEQVHAEVVNPIAGRNPPGKHMIADRQAGDAVDI